MERFAIKIDKKLKANLYKICRLCGMDYPDMIPILSQNGEEGAKDEQAIDAEGELEMSQKINVLIGLMITKDDRMPQTMCGLCVDKINDFYEFREMCYATNAQTRKLLGLKNVKKPAVETKPKVEFKEEPTIIPPLPNKFLNRKRKSEFEPPVPSKKEVAPSEPLKNETAPPAVSNKKLRLAALTLKKAKLKGKFVKETKKPEPEVEVKEEVREVFTRNMKLMKSKEVKDIKDEGKEIAVKEETKETTSKKDGKVKDSALKKDGKEVGSKKDKELTLKKDGKEVVSKKDSKEVITKKGKHKGKELKEAQDDGADCAVKEEIKEEIKEESAQTAPPVAPTTAVPPVPSAKLKQGCTICSERFATKGKLEAHLRSQHIPKVERYVCTACDETISKSFDIKNHQLWHKLSKTPYVCGLCGESIISTYAYARHLHEHRFETPPAFMVLDRECPQCHVLYETNFLYNIHPCAVKTRRCAGCNRFQRSEGEYVKHSALCAKVYLNYSKHIAPAVEAQEDAVRIKNENEVEAAAEEMARLTGMPLDMTPVVHLTRLSSPLIMAANQCVSIPGLDDLPTTTGKKSSKKGVSKKDLKRVDELLKSTLDALVSIKHEPEVHVETEAPPVEGETSDNEASEQDHNMDSRFQEDYHHNEETDDDDRAAENKVGVFENQESVKIKQETEDNFEANNSEGFENLNKSSGGGLKLKIRKEHGQLNSSIIEQQSVEKRGEKRKKKKKHKDKEKDKHQKVQKEHPEDPNSLDSFNTQHTEDNLPANATATIQIKMEPVEPMETEEHTTTTVQNRPQPEATIMTSIPMMQLQIACISEGVEFNGANPVTDTYGDEHSNNVLTNHASEQEDVKPNREELDRLLQISHVSSGVELESQVKIASVSSGIGMESSETGADASMEYDGNQEIDDSAQEEQHARGNEHESQIPNTLSNENIEEPSEKTTKLPKLKLKPKVVSKTPIKSRNKACKSTAKPSAPSLALQISAIQSGVNLPPSSEPMQSDFIPMFIKPEPQNRGYSDETALPSLSSSKSTSLSPPPKSPGPQNENESEENSSTHQYNAEEQAYISSIDFNNITVKQEKDLEINDVQISTKKSRSRNDYVNGIKKRKVNNSRSVLEDGADENVKDDSVAQDDDKMNEDDESEDEELEEEGEEEQDEEEGEEEEDEEELEEDDEEEEEREYRELEYPPQLTDPQEEEMHGTEENEESDMESDEASCNTLRDATENMPSNTQDTNNSDDTNISEQFESKPDLESEKTSQPKSLPAHLQPFVISSVCSHAPVLESLPTENHNESEQMQETVTDKRVSEFTHNETIGQSTEKNLKDLENLTETGAPPGKLKIDDHEFVSNTYSNAQQVLNLNTSLEPLHKSNASQENINTSECQQEDKQEVPVLKISSVLSGPIEFRDQQTFEPMNMGTELATGGDTQAGEVISSRSAVSIAETTSNLNQLGKLLPVNAETQGYTDMCQTLPPLSDQHCAETNIVQDETTTTLSDQNRIEIGEALTSQSRSQLEPGISTTTSSIAGSIISESPTKTTASNIVPCLNETSANAQDQNKKSIDISCPYQGEMVTDRVNLNIQSKEPETLREECGSAIESNEMTTQTNVEPCRVPLSVFNAHQVNCDSSAVNVDRDALLTSDANLSERMSVHSEFTDENRGIIPAQDNISEQLETEVSITKKTLMDPALNGSSGPGIVSAAHSSSDTIEGVVIQTAEMQLQAQPICEMQVNAGHSSTDQTDGNQDDNEEYDENEEDEYEDEECELAQNEEADAATEGREENQEEGVESEDHSNINVEEQQNQQNQDQQYSTRPTALALHPYLEDISSSSNSFLSNTLSQTPPLNQATAIAVESSTSRNCNTSTQQNNEETENILNESNYILSRRCQSPSSMAPFNFDNINEIAENNNNANIEREQLQDEHHHQQQQQRHHQQHTPDDVT